MPRTARGGRTPEGNQSKAFPDAHSRQSALRVLVSQPYDIRLFGGTWGQPRFTSIASTLPVPWRSIAAFCRKERDRGRKGPKRKDRKRI